MLSALTLEPGSSSVVDRETGISHRRPTRTSDREAAAKQLLLDQCNYPITIYNDIHNYISRL